MRIGWKLLLPLVLTPLVVVLDQTVPERHNLIFFVAMIAIIPLAGYIGTATEQLAARLGGGGRIERSERVTC